MQVPKIGPCNRFPGSFSFPWKCDSRQSYYPSSSLQLRIMALLKTAAPPWLAIVLGQQPFSFSKQNCCCWKVFKGRKGDEEGMVWGVWNWIEDRGGWNSLGEQLSENAADLCCNSPSIRLHQTTTSSEKYTSQTGRNALLQRAQKCHFIPNL